MAIHSLSANFRSFFGRLNPGSSFEATASSQYNTIKGLIEDRRGPAAVLSPTCFLQGSYRQQTATYSINDVDIVALCELWYPAASGFGSGPVYYRDDIFRIIAAPLLADLRYRDKVRYRPGSMCIKVDLGIKVEILPVVFKQGTSNPQVEPFMLYRPEKAQWEDGYARYHQGYLSAKNSSDRTQGNFIPAIKVLKHIRSIFNHQAVSFHLECLLYSVTDSVFLGGPADSIASVLYYIASVTSAQWYQARWMTPCGDRDIFTPTEWGATDWSRFHELLSRCSKVAQDAIHTSIQSQAIADWQAILGNDFFPATTA
jgi:hypothetical protein